MSKAVRRAMVTASVANVKGCVMLDEGSGSHWTSAPVSDVRNVLEELARLQKVEENINTAVTGAKVGRTRALELGRKYRDQWEVEHAHSWEKEAVRYLSEINRLEALLDS